LGALIGCLACSGGGGSGGNGSGTGGNGNGTGGNGSSTGGMPGTAGGIAETGPMLEGITAAHNVVRANVQPPASTPIPDLVWDPALAAVAQAWADACTFEHSSNGYGENLFASAGDPPPTAQDVVDDWAAEAPNYDYASNTCSGSCGHYTQVVWAGSLRLGCGATHCTTGSPFLPDFPEWDFWVCNYDPAGNRNNLRPY
jgi:hypothetical protein